MKNMHQIQRFNDYILDRDEAQNTGVITVTAGGTIVIAAKAFTLIVDQWLWVSIDVTMLKGASTGVSSVQLNKAAGTATVLWHGINADTEPPVWAMPSQSSGRTWEVVTGALVQCSVAGTYQPMVVGKSGGSDGTIAIGNGKIQVFLIR